ncbi:hypothetical protein HOY80DRAFT_1107733 [Tuber brumale]|nr:hypothetical protein HOY80DRAFT_1107733 [Tuber brumale]
MANHNRRDSAQSTPTETGSPQISHGRGVPGGRAGTRDVAQASTNNSSNIIVAAAVMEEAVAILAQISPIAAEQIWVRNIKGLDRQITIKTGPTVRGEVLPFRMLTLVLPASLGQPPTPSHTPQPINMKPPTPQHPLGAYSYPQKKRKTKVEIKNPLTGSVHYDEVNPPSTTPVVVTTAPLIVTSPAPALGRAPSHDSPHTRPARAEEGALGGEKESWREAEEAEAARIATEKEEEAAMEAARVAKGKEVEEACIKVEVEEKAKKEEEAAKLKAEAEAKAAEALKVSSTPIISEHFTPGSHARPPPTSRVIGGSQPGPSPLNLRIKTSEPRFIEDINSINDPAKILSPNPGLGLPLIGIKGCASVDEPDSGRLQTTCNPGGSMTPDSSTPRTAASNLVSGL